MKQVIKLFLVAVFAISSITIANAQAPKFGHYNSIELMGSLPERKQIADELQKYAMQLENQQKTMQEDLNKDYEEYLTRRDTLPKSVRALLEKKLQAAQEEMGIFVQQAQQDLQEKEMTLSKPLYDKFEAAVSEVGKENGFLYLFDIAIKSVAYFSPQSQDVTALIKKKMGVQ